MDHTWNGPASTLIALLCLFGQVAFADTGAVETPTHGERALVALAATADAGLIQCRLPADLPKDIQPPFLHCAAVSVGGGP